MMKQTLHRNYVNAPILPGIWNQYLIVRLFISPREKAVVCKREDVS